MFIQIHTLTGFSAALINRDDSGLSKKISFGGAMRTRISSQCLKYHWRTHRGEYALSEIGPVSERSRALFRLLIAEPLVAKGYDATLVVTVLKAFQDKLYVAKAKKDAAKGQDDEDNTETQAPKGRRKNRPSAAKADEQADVDALLKSLDRKEPIVLGQAEIAYLTEKAEQAVALSSTVEEAAAYAAEIIKEEKANLAQMVLGGGIDVALYGRIVPGDIKARTDAAVSVAHSFTTHRQEAEIDFFANVDGLLGTAAHMGDSELTSGIFYGYAVIDVDQLLANTGGDRELAALAVKHQINLIANVTPAGKRAANGSWSSSDFVMIEIGTAQPCSLANAFHRPVRSDWVNSVEALSSYVTRREAMRPTDNRRLVATLVDATVEGADLMSLSALAEKAAEAVIEG